MKIPKLPFELPELKGGLSRIFNFNRREVIIIGVSVAAVLVAALIIVVLNAGSRSTVALRKNEIPVAAEEVGGIIADRPFLSDFIIYEDSLEESFTGIIYSRESSGSWSDDQIEKYWIDPREIATDQLEKDAEKIIRDIFANVP